MTSDHLPNSASRAAMEKVAWLELLVSAAAIIVTLILIPFFGHGASSAFVLLGGVVCSYWFLRNPAKRTIMDERDQEIENQARRRGVETAWWFLLLALIVTVLLPQNDGFVQKTTLNWLIWIQFALFFGVKGLVGVILYRRQSHAS